MRKLYIPALIILLMITFISSDLTLAQNKQLLPVPGIVDDLRTLVGKTNPERLEALKILLDKDNIPYEVETFKYTSRRSEEEFEGANLVVMLGSGDREIVIGAHYDKVSVGDGVVDNGSSSVIIANIAAALKNENLNHKIRIVFFDAEESGLVGSRNYVETHADDNIVSMINLDVNGYGDTMMFGPTAQAGLNRLYRIAKAVSVDFDIEFAVFGRYGGSDDRSFARAGIENISIGIASAEHVHQFWLSQNAQDPELNPWGRNVKIMGTMHSDNDSMALIEEDAMVRVYNVVLETVKRLDQMGK
ncbi:M28 family metallopeptidase [candidate division KSB1 bacterium]